MSPRVRRTSLAAAAVVAIALAVLSPAGASASTARTPAATTPTMTAQVVHALRAGDAPYVGIQFHQPGLRDGYLSCNVYLPLVTSHYDTRSMDWQAGTTCNMPVVMSGTTYVFWWGGSNIAQGTTYSTWPGGALGASQGTIYGVQNGTYGVSHDVTVDIPAGVTTTVGSGCTYVNNNQSIHCHVLTGPIYFQPI